MVILSILVASLKMYQTSERGFENITQNQELGFT
jgi:hypothetical protein